MEKNLSNLFVDLVFGVAVGDALGCPVQFFSRKDVKSFNIRGMVGHGTYDMPAGTWTDDTSMTLCLVDSLAEKGELDFDDIMEKFVRWMVGNEYTPHGKAFDMGETCISAIFNYKKRGLPPLECGGKKENQNGNGSIMRIAPLAFYLLEKFGLDAFDSDEAFDATHKVSSLTHAHEIALIGCDIYLASILEAVRGRKKDEILKNVLPKMQAYVERNPRFTAAFEKYGRIFKSDFAALLEDSISSSGYVLHTLEAALWSFLTTDSYEECLLKVINLGSDTDSVGAVAGGLAAVYYSGVEGRSIPEKWVSKIENIDLIEKIVAKYLSAHSSIPESAC